MQLPFPRFELSWRVMLCCY